MEQAELLIRETHPQHFQLHDFRAEERLPAKDTAEIILKRGGRFQLEPINLETLEFLDEVCVHVNEAETTIPHDVL